MKALTNSTKAKPRTMATAMSTTVPRSRKSRKPAHEGPMQVRAFLRAGLVAKAVVITAAMMGLFSDSLEKSSEPLGLGLSAATGVTGADLEVWRDFTLEAAGAMVDDGW